jgi:hypothetical protein
MKLIEKFMFKRCSTEVQVMLTRMRERPEDFSYHSGWKRLVEIAETNSSPYTKIERKMIRAYWRECQLQRDRKTLLAQIMQQTINPTSRESVENGAIIMSSAQAKLYAQQAQMYNQAQQGLGQQGLGQQGLGQYSQLHGMYNKLTGTSP